MAKKETPPRATELEAVIASIRKEFGEGAIMKLGEA